MEDALAKEPSILDQRLEHQFTKLIVNTVLSITKPDSPSKAKTTPTLKVKIKI